MAIKYSEPFGINPFKNGYNNPEVHCNHCQNIKHNSKGWYCLVEKLIEDWPLVPYKYLYKDKKHREKNLQPDHCCNTYKLRGII